MTDRVNYSFGMKLPWTEQFSSVDFHISYSSDVKEGESPEEAFERVKGFVEEETEKEYGEQVKAREEAKGEDLHSFE